MKKKKGILGAEKEKGENGAGDLVFPGGYLRAHSFSQSNLNKSNGSRGTIAITRPDSFFLHNIMISRPKYKQKQ